MPDLVPTSATAPATMGARAAESKFIDRAHAQRIAWNATHPDAAAYWAQLSEDERAQKLRSRARAFAVFAAPVGRAAARMYDAVYELHRAFAAFLAAYPDDEALEGACRAAIEGADLDPAGADDHRGFDCFAAAAAEVAGWSHMIQVMLGIFEELAPPPGAGSQDEEECEEVPVLVPGRATA